MDVLFQPVMSIAFMNQMQFQLKMTDGKIKTSLFLQMGNHTTFLVIQMGLISRTISPSRHQVSYNDSNVNYQCFVGAVQRMCSLSLNDTSSISGSKYCLMERVQPIISEDLDPFYSLDINIHRRHFNWVTCSLIVCL